MKITFYGATEGVTGSNFYLETNNGIKFIVECGLFQGDEQTEKRNWDEFPFDPTSLDFALISHSHIDHIGRLPKLCKDGFQGFIYSTEPVLGFAEIFLQDTRKLLQDEAKKINKSELFSDQDVTNAVSRFKTYKYYETFEPAAGIKVTFFDAGHILGASVILVEADGKKIVFSGDLGNPPVPILRDTDKLPATDYVVMESTYGDRLHKKVDKRLDELEAIVKNAISKNGVLLMPSFAMERTQEILYELNDLANQGRIKNIPIFIDSPLAIRATQIYQRFPGYFDKEATNIIKTGDDLFQFPGLKMVSDMEESKAIDRDVSSKVIIAGSGMSNGGRIVFHEKRFLPEPSTTLAIVGYQVSGTLGRRLSNGEKKVEIMGETIDVRAEIIEMGSYSAHADQNKLIDWVKSSEGKVNKIFLVHGEPTAKEILKNKIISKTGIETVIAKTAETIDL